MALIKDRHDQLQAKARKGGTKAAFALTLGISKETLYQWMRESKEFSDAIAQYLLISQEHWEQINYNRATGKQAGGSDAAIKFHMANQFRDEYATERVESKNETKVDMTLDDAIKLLQQHGISLDDLK